MMRQGPAVLDRAARHRTEGARLRGRAFVDVNDEADEHYEGGDIVKDVSDGEGRPAERLWKPHRDSRDEEDDHARDDRPEVDLLAGVEEIDVLRFERVRVRNVFLQAAHPP